MQAETMQAHRFQEWKIQETAQNRQTPQESQHCWEEPAEQDPEPIGLNTKSNKRPFEQYQHYASQETGRPLQQRTMLVCVSCHTDLLQVPIRLRITSGMLREHVEVHQKQV